MALVLKLTKRNFKHVVRLAAYVMRNGGIVVYPTETSYGLGVVAKDRKAVKRLRKAKRMPNNKPISIIVNSLENAKKFGKIGRNAVRLVKKFMPGPLTIVVPKKKSLPNELSKKTVAFRISAHKFAHELCKEMKTAITATSANLHKEEACFSAEEAERVMGNRISIIIDAGNLRKISPSTIFDTVNGSVIRQGPIAEREIFKEWYK